MPNTLLSPTVITRESLRILHQKLNFIGTIERQYDDQFAKTGAKIGQNLTIRKPNQYTVRTGQVMVVQDTIEQSVVLTVSTIKGVDMQFDGRELTLTIDKFSDRYIAPAMTVLASSIEADALT
jgi:P22 coat protein - gene protein 5.